MTLTSKAAITSEVTITSAGRSPRRDETLIVIAVTADHPVPGVRARRQRGECEQQHDLAHRPPYLS
ncbi:hypothetical protein Q1M63_26430 [Sinorhizobium meliloti]|nr:hypothetical protein Q1M63_26430 [Sinorhizobium meliloti]